MVTRRRVVISAVVVVLVLAVAGGVGLWYFFSGHAPGAASIDQAAGAVASDAARAGATLGTTDGTWNVDTTIGSYSDYSSAWAGFRVQEVLSNIGNNTAIGRTPNVSGQLTLSGQTLSAVHVDVDLTSITSDQPRRDPAIQRTLETNTYPTATFDLTAPVSLPQAPVEGVTYNLTATGTMTVHGVTKAVTVTLQAQLKDSVIVVVGSTPFAFADYGMSAPAAPVVLSVSDSGTIEFQLFFAHA